MNAVAGKHMAKAALLALLAGALALCVGAAAAFAAAAPTPPQTSVPVLIVDGGTGDAPAFISDWLGASTRVVAQQDSSAVRVWTAQQPIWWGVGVSPPTYVLAATDSQGVAVRAPLRVAQIAWGLDRIAAQVPRTPAFVIAQGAVGLQVRSYLEDLGQPKQSQRADVAGVLLLGCPNRGLSLMPRFSSLATWARFAAGAGLTAADLAPGSAFLRRLNAPGHGLPTACRVAVAQGSSIRLTNVDSDGVVAVVDSSLPGAVLGSRPAYLTTATRASDGLDLAPAWRTETRAGGAQLDRVSPQAITTLGQRQSYAAAGEVRAAAHELYATWFAGGPPTTHLSTRLVLDTSGSMAAAWSGSTKIAAARTAARDFVQTFVSPQPLSGATPEDLGLITFADTARIVVPVGTPAPAIWAGLARVQPAGSTNVGQALRVAIESFRQSPRAADRTIVLLSDGVNTAGLNDPGIMAGPVQTAHRQGIRIDTIAVGSVDQADQAFLARLSRQTGGSFNLATDLLQLRSDFLRAKLSSLGALVADRSLDVRPSMKPIDVVTSSYATKRLAIVVVPTGKPSSWRLTLDGLPVRETGSGRTQGGVSWYVVPHPAAGRYALQPIGATSPGKAQILAAADSDPFNGVGPLAAAGGGFPWLLVLVMVGVALCAATVLTRVRYTSRQNQR